MDVSIVNKKTQLRQQIKEKTLVLDQQYCRLASRKIVDRVKQLKDYKNAGMVFCFVGSKGEVDTLLLVEEALTSGKRVCVPLCVADGIMEAREITNIKFDLSLGMMGILEPSDKTPLVSKGDIDFAVIPCITCDHKGNRVGHGKGYYDRYLTGSQFATAVVCFEELISEEIPMDDFDRKIDRVITDVD